MKFPALLFLLLVLYSCGPALPEGVEQAMQQVPEQLDYNIHVKPILSDRCYACHGPDKNAIEAGLQLHDAGTAYAESVNTPGQYAIVPGKLKKSEVFHRLVSEDPETMMPPPEFNLVLSDYEKAVLIKWIEEGAAYKPHWSFIKPEKPALPKLENKEWVNNEIDYFIQAALERKDWQGQPEADKELLLRRVSFDLTGLPPDIREMEEFIKDDSPDAYEKAVDRLLASPHYGERMATDWLDVARYADTHGYTVDRYRDMSPWRGWVIKAFNENMSFDQFTHWQMAGDLLPEEVDPEKRREQILATGFNRNHQQNMEGGIVPEEFRVEYVADRTNTLGAAFLGLTLECSRCHDHKYDPVSQKEYFQLFSFFNNIKEAGQISFDNAAPAPTLILSDSAAQATVQFIEQQISTSEQELENAKAFAKSGFENWLISDRLNLDANNILPKAGIAHFNLDDETLKNKLNPKQKGSMKQAGVADIPVPELVEGRKGKALQLDGDAWLDLGGVGAFDRTMPFSVSVWVNLPAELKHGVIVHKGDGAALYNFRGFHLALKDNRLEMLMAHNAPYNAIIEYGPDLPRDEWIQLAMTHDGSGKAVGLKVYLNGREMNTTIDQDNLYKDIVFFNRKQQPGLQVGARWRGIGIKGAVVDDIAVFDRTLTGLELLALHDLAKAKSLLNEKVNSLSANDKALLREWMVARKTNQSPVQHELKRWRSKHNETIDTIPEIMIMDEMETPRQSYILERGAYDAHGEEVFPATPESILAMPDQLPRNRLGLSQWLMHKDNPLTSRVIANRYWQQLFGRGLVKTTEDFGNQGELPSHPELLDWLAVEFRESGWNVKALLKKIVMSAAYRQSSKAAAEILEADVENVFLARGPSARLSAEMIRDNALAASGLLVKKIGGKSVKPYQPEGLWRVNGGKYVPDTGEKLYRRSLYTFWKRSVPHPTQATFDAPTRSNCTVKRQKTSTPLQALVLLNDPTFTEAAKILGVEISSAIDLKTGIARAFRKLTGRKAHETELKLLMDLQASEYKKFQQRPEKMNGWLNSGATQIGTADAKLDKTLVAANTVVASTIINADATIVKR